MSKLLPIIYALSLCVRAFAGDRTWPAIPQDELALKDDPRTPGSKAIMLYREVVTDDAKGLELRHVRIKVLSEEGRSSGDVQIPYLNQIGVPADIRARVVQPDGRTVEFEGEIFDKVIFKARKFRFQAKTFTLPEVKPGSIIEYSYVIHQKVHAPDVIRHPADYLITGADSMMIAHWVLQSELFTLHAQFTVKPVKNANLLWTSNASIPQQQQPAKEADGSYSLRLENIPGIPAEEFAPPEDAIPTQIDFFYPIGIVHSANDFWVSHFERYADAIDSKLGPLKAARHIVDATVAENDAPETKLRKLYDRAQTYLYLDAERRSNGSTEDLKPAKDVPELLKRGYGSGRLIDFLLIALARAAGFEAAAVMVADRERTFFRPNLMDPSQLDLMVVRVKAGSKEYFLQPAALYCPFDILPWNETGTGGYRIDKPLAVYTTTPVPRTEEALIERTGSLQIDSDGKLQGKVQVIFSGQEALQRRSAGSALDDQARRKMLVEEFRSRLPAGSSVEVTDLNKWNQSAEPLRAEFTISVPNYATSTGRRLLLPLGFLRESDSKLFQNAQRTLPIYFPYPYRHSDEINIQIPEAMTIESLPKPSSRESPVGSYEISCKGSGRTLNLTRKMTREGLLYRADEYPQLRSFFNGMRAGDEGQSVLRTETRTDADHSR